MPSKKRRTGKSRKAVPKARTRQAKEARTRALHAVAQVRRGMSLSKAAKREGTTIQTVLRYAGTTVDRTPTGRYSARSFDRMKRPMRVPTESGIVVLDVRDSRKASELARYWNAVHNYLRTGIDAGIRRLQGKGVTVDGEFFEYVTDLSVLEILARAGEIQFEDIYEPTA